jgi:hypothetical protein
MFDMKSTYYYMKLQQREDIPRIIEDLKNFIDEGENPNDKIDEVLAEYGMTQDDLEPNEIAEITREIESYWRNSGNAVY